GPGRAVGAAGRAGSRDRARRPAAPARRRGRAGPQGCHRPDPGRAAAHPCRRPRTGRPPRRLGLHWYGLPLHAGRTNQLAPELVPASEVLAPLPGAQTTTGGVVVAADTTRYRPLLRLAGRRLDHREPARNL